MIDAEFFWNLGLVVVFVLVGGVFAATEIALVSLRESQLSQLERKGPRGERVAEVARDPNRFLAAVQIGVTVAGFFSAAYGGSTLAPDVAPYLERAGLAEGAADAVALVLMTLAIAYLSLVLGELVPKRLALQRSGQLAMLTAPPLDRFATVMRPVIWVLSISTDALVRLLGGDPKASSEEVSSEELHSLVTSHEGLEEDQRRILADVFSATTTTLREVMRPRVEVVFVDRSVPLTEAVVWAQDQPYSRYPVMDGSFDTIVGFLHVRDLLGVAADDPRTVGDIAREVLVLPDTKAVLPTVSTMRQTGTHLAVVVDEYGGTNGIVTLEDLVEEFVGEIRDEYDVDPGLATGDERSVPGGLSIEDFAERTGVELPDGDYETVAGYVIAQLGRVPEVGAAVAVDDAVVEVTEMEGRRVTQVSVTRTVAPLEGEEAADQPAADRAAVGDRV